MKLFACALVVCGCSATGVPIVEPEHVTPLATAIPLSESVAIAWSITDVVRAAKSSLLHAPPGAIATQLVSGGNITIAGTATQPADRAETLTLTIAYDGYKPKINVAVMYTDWTISSATAPTSTIAFSNEPLAPGEIGDIDGTFDGTIQLAQGEETGPGDDVDARLVFHGYMSPDDPGMTKVSTLAVSGIIYSPAFGYYYNDTTIGYPTP